MAAQLDGQAPGAQVRAGGFHIRHVETKFGQTAFNGFYPLMDATAGFDHQIYAARIKAGQLLFGPVEALRAIGDTLVTLRITLSTFITPNPSEASRGSRYRYASHNLRFKINRADENAQQFMARISMVAEQPDGPESAEEDLWDFGSNRRDVGSLHIDQLTCRASDLARCNLITVHPVAGRLI